MRSKVLVAYEVSVGVLGLLGKAWKNTREIGETFFTGKQYSKDTLKKVVSEVDDNVAMQPDIYNKVAPTYGNGFTREVYDKYVTQTKAFSKLSEQERINISKNSPEVFQAIQEFGQRYNQAFKDTYVERVNALTPQKRELFEAYKVSQTDPVWKQTGNPNVRINGFTGLRLRDVGKPGQGTEDLLSVSAITAGAVVGYSALSHFAGDKE